MKRVDKLFFTVRWRLYNAWIRRRFAAFGRGTRIYPSPDLLVGEEYVSLGKDVTIGKHVQLTAWDHFLGQHFTPEIVIGDGCAIGDGAHITAVNRIELGKNVLTGKYVLISDNSHGATDPAELEMAPNQRRLTSKGPVVIEDNVWIGEKASILSGVHIGKGAIIGAGAVVTKDVPAGHMALGVPARILSMVKHDEKE